MSSCVTFDTNGFLVQSTSSPDECQSYILISPLEHDLMVQTVDINPDEILSIFTLSFVAVITLSALAFKVDVFKNIITRS
jgi:hypothetical protein